jgi:very-short-patch-repair endonuclease
VNGEIRRFAAAHYGLVDRPTALTFGMTDRMIERKVEAGIWKIVHAGVYYLNVTPRTWSTDVLAAVLAAGPLALASHRTASRLWEVDGVGGRVIEVTVPHDDRPIPEGVLVHRTRRELTADEVKGIPVTTPERMLHDLAAILSPLPLEKAYMSSLHMRLTTPDKVVEQLRLQGGRGVRGTPKLRRIVPLADEGRTASGSEVELRSLIRRAPVPSPIHQFRISLPTGSNAYPDFSWPDRLKIVEVDGFDSHSTPEQIHDDLIRQNMLMDLGWEMRRFTGRRIRREPQTVIEEITRFVLSHSG